MFKEYSKEELEKIVELLKNTQYRTSRGHKDVLMSRNYLIAYCLLHIRDKSNDVVGTGLEDQALYDKFIDSWLASELGIKREAPKVR